MKKRDVLHSWVFPSCSLYDPLFILQTFQFFRLACSLFDQISSINLPINRSALGRRFAPNFLLLLAFLFITDAHISSLAGWFGVCVWGMAKMTMKLKLLIILHRFKAKAREIKVLTLNTKERSLCFGSFSMQSETKENKKNILKLTQKADF